MLLKTIGLVVVLSQLIAPEVRAQLDQDNLRHPRFLVMTSAGTRPLDVRATPALMRRIALDLNGVRLREALKAITSRTGLRIVFNDESIPLDARVHLKADDIAVAAALMDILLDTGIDVVLHPAGYAVLTRRGDVVAPPVNGEIHGRVTDMNSRKPLVGATVAIKGSRHMATTVEDGRYAIRDVPAGTHTVRARYIGYAPRTSSVTVADGQQATLDFGLERSAQRLDEVVTTGTLIPTEVKAMPTPVSIITSEDFSIQRPRTVQGLFRQAVPGAVAWDAPAYPIQTTLSVRGSSSISGGGQGQMKVFVDGIPMADITFASIDPNSIERVEVIRGPQAAAIYGSDALGGVIQMFTKRGLGLGQRPEFSGEAGFGLVQTPYQGYSEVVRQGYRASIAGGGAEVSYNFGAGYDHMPDWAEPQSSQSQKSAYGGIHFTRGLVTVDLSGRYYLQRLPAVYNPELASTGHPFWSKPQYSPTEYLGQALGAKLTLEPRSGWRTTVTAGIDRMNFDVVQTRPRLTSPADTFLTAYNYDETKTFISVNSAIRGQLSDRVTGSITLGVDYYSIPLVFWYTGTLLTTSPPTGNLGQGSITRSVTTNSGYFAQAQLALSNSWFLTTGLRAEQNSNFGDDAGTPVSPQVGMTYVQPLGSATLKLRGAWGRAIRPPTPGAKFGNVSSSSRTLPNPDLGPERQQGWDGGVDLLLGGGGSISATYFNQTAENLIALLFLGSTPLFTYQNRNVGEVKNKGVELEAGFRFGSISVRGQYAYVHSRVQDPGDATSGEIVAGDKLLAIPEQTAGASISFAPRTGTTVSGGVTYVGEYGGYDIPTLYRCFAGTGPCLTGPGLRPYRIMLPSLFKLNANVTQHLRGSFSAFLAIDNITNDKNHEFVIHNAVVGRITTVGLQVRY